MMARSLSVDSGYDRWKDSAVEQRSREPIGTFPSVTVRTGRSGNITDALVSTTEYQTNSGEKGEAQVQGMSGASVDPLWCGIRFRCIVKSLEPVGNHQKHLKMKLKSLKFVTNERVQFMRG